MKLYKCSIAERRLFNQRITGPLLRGPADVVRWCGAVQAQEYEPAKWALGLRIRDGASADDVERAFTRGEILRTHVMRPTWHFVARDDIRWVLDLTAPRVHRILASYCRRTELEPRTLQRAAAIFEAALRDHRCLTRTELREQLQRSGILAAGVRLAFLTMYAELEGVICSGPRRGRQFTYALVAERAPEAIRLDRDDALARLTTRYFSSHGPATIRDFVWWSGLTSADARRGLDMIRARCEENDGLLYWSARSAPRPQARTNRVHLLPIYDEYLVAYRDRKAVPYGSAKPIGAIGPRTYAHTLVIDGQIAGTWRPSPAGDDVVAKPVRRLTERERTALAAAAKKYGRFRG